MSTEHDVKVVGGRKVARQRGGGAEKWPVVAESNVPSKKEFRHAVALIAEYEVPKIVITTEKGEIRLSCD